MQVEHLGVTHIHAFTDDQLRIYRDSPVERLVQGILVIAPYHRSLLEVLNVRVVAFPRVDVLWPDVSHRALGDVLRRDTSEPFGQFSTRLESRMLRSGWRSFIPRLSNSS